MQKLMTTRVLVQFFLLSQNLHEELIPHETITHTLEVPHESQRMFSD